MHNTSVKNVLFCISMVIIASLACNLSVPTAPTTSPAPQPTDTVIPGTPTSIPTTAVPVITATVPVPSFEGVEVAVDPLSLVLSPQLASGVRGEHFPPASGDNVAPWEVTPGHTLLTLEGYILQDKFHQPQIFVYPAQAYAELYPAAFESIRNIDNLLYNPGMPISNEQLPHVPFFNAAQAFASNIQFISFQNGQGVRFLTEYAQYFAPINNHDLFYHFQGLTTDGAYYIIAILPITAPVLAETSEAGAAVPAGGIALPDMNDPNADWQGYYTAVATLLHNTSPESFSPTINQLDLLIQSMRVTP